MVVLKRCHARWLAIGLLMLAVGASAFAGRSRAPATGIYGIADERLLTPDANSKAGGSKSKKASKKRRKKGTAVTLSDVSAMTYDARSGQFYAVKDASSKPQLISVDPATSQATVIGPITLPGVDLTLVEGLAIDPEKGQLYAAGGDSTFASNVLMTVDPANAQARPVAEIRGTIQRDVDAMAFVGEELYIIDGAGQNSSLYRIDPATARATAVGSPFLGKVTDLAYDATHGRLTGAQSGGGPMLAISLEGQVVGEFPVASGELRAVAIIPEASAAASGR